MWWFLSALLATTTSLSACGGGDSGPSKEDYIAEADAICRPFDARYNHLIDQINQSQELPSTPANDQALWDLEQQEADEIQGAVRQLERLSPPTEDQATVQRMLDGLSETGELWTGQADADSASDFTTSKALSDRQDEALAQTQGIAKGYGFKDCP